MEVLFYIPVYRWNIIYRWTIVDGNDAAKFSGYRWRFNRRTYKGKNWEYVRRNKGRGYVLMHREVLGIPKNQSIVVDHKNHNTFDNRSKNLRVCSTRFNIANQTVQDRNKTRMKGVYWEERTKRFRARITILGKDIKLGRFKTAEEAGKAYDIAALKEFGEFAVLNFPPCV